MNDATPRDTFYIVMLILDYQYRSDSDNSNDVIQLKVVLKW